jgi:stage V sporulation protein D (sporulation-specific penicillin-binding protein)
MLTGVVERGTGKAAALHGLKIAGKTGTAQIFDSAYSKKHYVASFAGYLPADNPKIAMMIVLDKPKTNIYGGSTAAPIFRNIAQSWISVSNDLLSDLKNSEDADKIVIIPDFTGLDYFSAVKILKKLGLKYQKYDKNFVIASQMPPSGTKIKNKNNITIKFSPSKKKKKRIYAK